MKDEEKEETRDDEKDTQRDILWSLFSSDDARCS